MDQSSHRDRSGLLTALGVVQILVGLGCGVLLLGVIASDSLATRSGGAPLSQRAVASTIFVLGMAAFHFVTVGVGSMRARRWARALSVVVSALWLAGGTVATIATVTIVPRVAPDRPLVATAAGMFVALIVLSLALLFLYARPDVRATCEHRDRARWTDRVPLPVLALSLILAFAAASLLVSLSDPVVPLFGTVVSGAPAALSLLALAILCAVLAVGVYRLKTGAWLAVVLLQIIGSIVAGVTMARTSGGLARDAVVWTLLAGSWLLYLGFLLSLRRYFAGGRSSRPQVIEAT
ncbi:MAG TPA: hypothetical protein VFN10_09405 [Thermoanaerobaculia bacterium]|nr:hypothetical protein [Thermoanaerobaculia bacterium]